MSDRGRHYVDKHSPYSGTTFLIHYRLGDLENDTYGHRLFMGIPWMAKKCRCSKKTIQRAMLQMVEDGFLELLFPETAEKAAEYIFLFPGEAVDNLTTDGDGGGQLRKERWTSTETTPIYVTKEYNNSSSPTSDDAGAPVLPKEPKIYNEEVVDLTTRLNDWIERNGYKQFTEGPKQWCDMDKLMRIDKHDYDEVAAVIDWCQKDAFWNSNIRSTFKLRDKYDALLGRMRQEGVFVGVVPLETISPDDLIAALAYDGYDSKSGEWCDPNTGEMTLDNPAARCYTRPTNREGQLIDSEGNTYKLDAQGIRRSVER